MRALEPCVLAIGFPLDHISYAEMGFAWVTAFLPFSSTHGLRSGEDTRTSVCSVERKCEAAVYRLLVSVHLALSECYRVLPTVEKVIAPQWAVTIRLNLGRPSQ